jgi:DNA-directed RNA polymerase specialized sigma24 family protein/CheY-like chemotaxis protein
MSLRETLGRELPYLRRYARAITGSQQLGDSLVREMLEALIEDARAFSEDTPPRQEVFKVFHRIWDAASVENIQVVDRSGVIAELPMATRQALLLSAVEGFSDTEIADILGLDVENVESAITSARALIQNALSARVLIIEDESIIAMHLQSIVRGLGHEVTSTVRTRDEAVRGAREQNPDLILADISLADGSSGIDAVNDILQDQQVPVIFITAFPERLLTGQRPEPTYLITKPFEPDTVAATIWQALIVHREVENAMPLSSGAEAVRA